MSDTRGNVVNLTEDEKVILIVIALALFSAIFC
jgi:hypothetical protein